MLHAATVGDRKKFSTHQVQRKRTLGFWIRRRVPGLEVEKRVGAEFPAPAPPTRPCWAVELELSTINRAQAAPAKAVAIARTPSLIVGRQSAPTSMPR